MSKLAKRKQSKLEFEVSIKVKDQEGFSHSVTIQPSQWSIECSGFYHPYQPLYVAEMDKEHLESNVLGAAFIELCSQCQRSDEFQPHMAEDAKIKMVSAVSRLRNAKVRQEKGYWIHVDWNLYSPPGDPGYAYGTEEGESGSAS